MEDGVKLKLMGVLLVLAASAWSQRLEHKIVLPDSLTSAKRPSVLLYNPTDTTLWVGADQQVLVLKPVTGAWVAKMRVQHQVTQMCLNQSRDKVYIGSMSDSMMVADAATHSIVRRVPNAGPALQLVHSRASDRIFYAAQDTFLGVVDCALDSVIGHIAVNGIVSDICVNPDGSKLYCATEADMNMQVIDCIAESVVKSFWTGYGPFHLFYNPLANKVYCTEYEDEDLAIVDAVRDSLLRFISFDYRPGVLGFNPRENKVYCALQATALAVISGATDSLLAEAYVDGTASAIACDSLNNVVYATASGNDCVSLVNGSNNGSMGHLPVGDNPVAVCNAPGAGKLYVANRNDASLTEVGGDPPQVLGTLVIGMEPWLLDWAGNVNRVYCTDRHRGRLAVIDADRDSVCSIKALPVPALAVLAVPAENKVYCAGGSPADSTALSVVVQPQDSLARTTKLAGYVQSMLYDPAFRMLVLLDDYPLQLLGVDCRNDSLRWSVALPGQVGGMTLAFQEDRVFVGSGDSVTAYDAETGSRFASIQLAGWPYLLSYVSGHNQVAVAQQLGDSIVFISAATCSVAGRVWTPGYTASMVYNRRHDRLYCSSGDSGLVAIDCATLEVTPIPSTYSASRLLLDTIADKLYSLAYATVQVLDCNTNLLVESLPIGDEGGTLAWNPVNRRVYVSMPMESEILAFYDSTIAAIAEAPASVLEFRTVPGIVAKTMFIPGLTDPQMKTRIFLLDMTGRRVRALKPGLNDVSSVAAGVYFVRDLRPGVGGRGEVRKVVIAR
jgi:DNA-binding beta-propeller fold protein YncE